MTTEPVKPSETEATKAFSKLYNESKAKEEAWATEKADMQKKLDDSNAENQKKADDNKTSEQLMSDLNSSRTENATLKKSAEVSSTSMKEMISKATEGLTAEQKELVKLSSDDPYKKMQFINTLKGTSTEPVVVPTKTSQGATPGSDQENTIDVDSILKAAANGDIGAYREAKKKFGDKETQRFIAEHNKVS